MNRKTEVVAEPASQNILVTREFDLPVNLLFKAYTEARFLEQWMGTKVIKLDNHNHGSFRFETTDPMGNVHGFNGTIHEVVPDQKITRTFKMENSPFPVQLEFLEFEGLNETSSKLKMNIIHKSVKDRDAMMKLPFAQGLNMAHNRLQNILFQ